MENDLSEVLEGSDTPNDSQVNDSQVQEPQGVNQPEPPSGEEPAANPSEPNEVHGLKAAIAAERQKRQEYERQLAEYQRQMQEYQQQAQPQQQRDPNAKPSAEQFQTYEDYLEALADWKVEQREAARAEREQQEAQQRRMMEIERQYSDRAAAFAASAPDYHTVVNDPTLPITKAMAAIIKEAENGPQIAYYLAKNRAEAARISQLSPVQAAFAMFGLVNNQVAPVENAIQQATQPTRLPGSLSNERAAVSNGKEPFHEPSLEDLLTR